MVQIRAELGAVDPQGGVLDTVQKVHMFGIKALDILMRQFRARSFIITSVVAEFDPLDQSEVEVVIKYVNRMDQGRPLS